MTNILKISRFRWATAGLTCGLLALTVIFSASQPATAADPQKTIALARQEAQQGKFVNMISSPKSEKAQRAIMEAFEKRFDMKLDWQWLPLNSGVSGPRMVEQAKSNVRLPSVVGGYSYFMYDLWVRKHGLHTSVDWEQDFSSLFPDIKIAATDQVLPGFRGQVLAQWDVQYVMVYNTDQVKPTDAPKSLQELADPKWRARFAMSNNNTTPLDLLALDWGVNQTVDLTKRLLANQPRFKPGPPAVVGAIASGEVAVGVSGYTALAEALKVKGAPIAWAPWDRLPISTLFVFMLKNSPQPNLSKLFLAWFVTEGRQIQEQEEFLSSFADKSSRTTRTIRAAAPQVKVVEIRTESDQKVVDDAAAAVMRLVTGVTGSSTMKK